MRLLALCGATGLLLGCWDGTGPSLDLSITVLVSTTGLHPDPDGYTVSLDGGAERAIPANGSLELGVNENDHTVVLRGIAGNCRNAGENPKTISMSSEISWGGLPTYADKLVYFDVACDWNASLKVTVATTGSNFDPAGTYGFVRSPPYPYGFGGEYDVSVNGSRIIGPVMAGVYSLKLYVPSNCAVSGDDPRSVVLVHDQVVETTFPVTCS